MKTYRLNLEAPKAYDHIPGCDIDVERNGQQGDVSCCITRLGSMAYTTIRPEPQQNKHLKKTYRKQSSPFICSNLKPDPATSAGNKKAGLRSPKLCKDQAAHFTEVGPVT